MENFGTTENTSCIPLPPPPPPLPLKSPSIQSYCKQHSCDKNSNVLQKSSENDIITALRHLTSHFDAANPGNLISFYNAVSPVIQEGRCCGIVALSMASQLFQNKSAAEILGLAKSLNFTKEGEMFSVYNMATLAETLLDCDAVVLDDINAHKVDLLNHVCDGHPVLIPYDADKNHSPCINHGLSAHWAIVTGLSFTISRKGIVDSLSKMDKITEYSELNTFIVKDNLLVKDLLQHAEKIFLYVHQGKSRHLAAWNLKNILESNRNMFEVTKKYSSDDLVLPANDYLSELRNKALILKKK